MKEYIKRDGLTLKVEVRYSLGGHNHFTYQNEARGYYLHVTPVEVNKTADGIVMESFVAFSGIKELLKEVKRKSKKAEAESIEIAETRKEDLIKYVLSKQVKSS